MDSCVRGSGRSPSLHRTELAERVDGNGCCPYGKRCGARLWLRRSALPAFIGMLPPSYIGADVAVVADIKLDVALTPGKLVSLTDASVDTILHADTGARL